MAKDLVLSELTRILVSEAGVLREAYEKESVEGIQFTSVSEVIKDIFQLMNREDPIGKVTNSEDLSSGVRVAEIGVPKGTIGFVYDGNPLSILSTAAKAIKTDSHLIILANSKTEKICKLLVKFVKLALEAQDMFVDSVKLIIGERLEDFFQRKELDLILVDGSSELWNECQTIGLKKINPSKKKRGLSHFYVDELVNVEGAVNVIVDSVNGNGISHPIDTVLVHSHIASELLPALFNRLDQKQFLFHLDTKSWNIFNNQLFEKSEAQLATDEDWYDNSQKEEMNVKIVDSFEEGIIHIFKHGNKKFDGILSDIPLTGMIFSSTINSEQILINVSSRYCREDREDNSDLLKVSSTLKLEELMGSKILIQGNYFIKQLA